MLVLSRKIGQTINVGGAVVKVIEIHRGKVRLGVQADERTPVHRGEVIERIEAEKRQAHAERLQRTRAAT